MKDIGGLPNQRVYWGKGVKPETAKRADDLEYHPYTKIGFICTNDRGEPIIRNEASDNK